MAWESRIIGHGEAAPADLVGNPLNWRTHPKAQRDALAGVLDEVGWVQNVIVNKRSGFIVDGHARVAEAAQRGESSVPVVYVDLSDEEERKVLATLDPLSAMAGQDAMRLQELLEAVESQSTDVSDLLDSLRGESIDINDLTNWKDEWEGMPEFEQDDVGPYQSILVHFRGEKDVAEFKILIEQGFTEKAKSIWFPVLREDEKNDNTASAYVDG